MVYDKQEPIENLITWVYQGGAFVPSAKIIGEEKFSIINDYIGRPVQAYDEKGNVVWETDYDIYGCLKDLKGDRSFIPFRQLGQYEDLEIGLYYNRYRYYSFDTGMYISQDPIGLMGGRELYKYIHDCNSWVDIFGLMPLGNPVNQGHHVVPHKAATDLGIKPFNSQTGVPSLYWDDTQFTGDNHKCNAWI